MQKEAVFDLLEELHDRFNRVEFIENDPISIPHKYTIKEDIEISGFLSATLAWGQRKQIILKANQLMELMDNAPFDYIINASKNDLLRLNKFYYRTFQSVDALFFVSALKHIYKNIGGLETLFKNEFNESCIVNEGLRRLFWVFYDLPHEDRSMKHIANIEKGSSAKRLNMFLRWMVRKDNRGVDFGIWKSIPMAELYLPLDVHTGRTARLLNLLSRKQNDWKSVLEVTATLRKFCPDDPIKYDFALFGAGVEKII